MSRKVTGAPVLQLVQDDRHSQHAAGKLARASPLVAGQLPHHPAVVVGNPRLRAVLRLSACRMKHPHEVSCSQLLASFPHHLRGISRLSCCSGVLKRAYLKVRLIQLVSTTVSLRAGHIRFGPLSGQVMKKTWGMNGGMVTYLSLQR